MQPVLSLGKPDHFFIRQPQRPHDRPLVPGRARLGRGLALEGRGSRAHVLTPATASHAQEHFSLFMLRFLFPVIQVKTNTPVSLLEKRGLTTDF